MSEEVVVEQAKCMNAKSDVGICRICMRNGVSETENYAEFSLKKTLMNGWKCDGYVSKREKRSLL